MKVLRLILGPAYGLALLLQGCAQGLFTTTIQVPSPFEPDEAKYAMTPGPGSIKGSAFIRQQGGGIVTCAGAQVVAVPATRYATDRISALYGNIHKGQYFGGDVKFVPDDPRYLEMRRNTRCDAQGNFQFDGLARGDYFVITNVRWLAGNQQQGGALMQRVTIKDGQPIDIMLVP